MSSTKSSEATTVEKSNKRGNWSHKLEFILSCIGLSVGIGNVWRYPYVAFENGGGTFQIPYAILSIFIGYPLYYLEIARGQYSQSGALAVWHSCPAAIGIGWGMIVTVFIGITYYNVIISYTMLYMIFSFTKKLPWADCNEWWGADDNCYVRTKETVFNESNVAGVFCNNTSCANPETATKQFWEKYVLNIGAANGIDNLNVPQWKLVSVLAGTWILIFLCVFKGIKTSGKAVYVTATLPYFLLLALLIQGLLLDGAIDGLKHFSNPKWNKLLEIKVWFMAAQQMVYSLSLSNGGLITLASYNRFHNTLHRDALQIVILDFLTSLIASTVVFAVIGSLAKSLSANMDKIFTGGQGLAFIIFPEVVTLLPVPQLWCFMFFLMIFALGIDSTFASLEALWTAVFDDRPKLEKHQTLLYFISCVVFFLLGLIYCTAGGQYVLNLVDGYSVMGRTLLTAWEVIAVMWIYGLDKFCQDVNLMLNFKPNIFLQICWKYVCPIIILALTIGSWCVFSPPTYGLYKYPTWAHVLGWFIAMTIILQPFSWAIFVVYKYWKKGDWREAFQPNKKWLLMEETRKATLETSNNHPSDVVESRL